MITALIIGGIILFIIFIFASPTLSPIPYFPSNHKDLDIILKTINLSDKQVLFDMGAGDGVVIMAAATEAYQRKIKTQFVAIEMNPILAAVLAVRAFLHPNRKNITVVWSDMFKVNLRRFAAPDKSATVYLYVSPRFIPPIMAHIRKNLTHATLISYFYPAEANQQPTFSGVHHVYKKNL